VQHAVSLERLLADYGPVWEIAKASSEPGGAAGSPVHIGRARVDGAGLDRSIHIGQGAFLLTSPGASS